MNKLRILLTFALTFVLSAVGVSAQDNGLNPVYKVQLTDITYQKNEVKYQVSAVLTDIVATRKVKAYDRKDSKGLEYKETKTYYGAIVAISTD